MHAENKQKSVCVCKYIERYSKMLMILILNLWLRYTDFSVFPTLYVWKPPNIRSFSSASATPCLMGVQKLSSDQEKSIPESLKDCGVFITLLVSSNTKYAQWKGFSAGCWIQLEIPESCKMICLASRQKSLQNKKKRPSGVLVTKQRTRLIESLEPEMQHPAEPGTEPLSIVFNHMQGKSHFSLFSIPIDNTCLEKHLRK